MDFLPLLLVFASGIIGIALAYQLGRRSPPADSVVGKEEGETVIKSKPSSETKATDKSKKEKKRDFQQWASFLSDKLDKIATTDGILQHPRMAKAVADLQTQKIPTEDLVVYLKSTEDFQTMLALQLALGRDDLEPELIKPALFEHIRNPETRRTLAVFRFLPEIIDGPLIGPVLAAVYYPWDDFLLDQGFRKFIASRLEAGEKLTLGEHLHKIESGDLDDVKSIVKRLPDDQSKPLLEELGNWTEGNSLDDARNSLSQFAQVFKNSPGVLEDGSPLVTSENLEQRVGSISERFLQQKNSRSVLVTGSARAGKSSLIQLVAKRLHEKEYLVVSATSSDLLSGQMYFGQLEQRIREFLQILRRYPVVWVVENFHELALAGQHKYSTASILDMILPDLLAGKIRVLGELPTASLERLQTTSPQVKSALDVINLPDADQETTLQMAADWVNNHPGLRGKKPQGNSAALEEGLKLARQYSQGHAQPGLLLDLLKTAFQQEVEKSTSQMVSLDRPALVRALSAKTGMPLEVIDEECPLDLPALKELFDESVLGQPEAVTTLVERVAMIKAGLTDPTRPLGVFLFAGPTGTGKTEIAKTLANFLFGSTDRMIRIDMSELQDPSSLGRLIGSCDQGPSAKSLASQVRQQPFSLILLDEFEKANRHVWDLFLQVFDDGRLTDANGNTADLRNTILILTSNLGALDAQSNLLGFNTEKGPQYRPGEINKAIEQTFRKEFVNRIDRIVTFRPLSRETMREILRHQLRKTLTRRGLRNRPWLVEWDDSATEFLLENGFSPSMGARPLMRAIDQFLLGPLSRDIVNGTLSADEQLLFISARDGRLQWDSSLAVDSETPTVEEPESLPEFSNRRLILQPAGSDEELQNLAERVRDLEELLQLDNYLELKASCLAEMQAEGFWQDSSRWQTLALAEYIDRVESSLQAGSRSIDRLLRQPESRPTSSEQMKLMVSKQALRVFLLEMAYPEITAKQANDAVIVIAPTDEGRECLEFGDKLRAMYQGWADLRGMKLEVINQPSKPGWAAKVSGFGAVTLLENEAGIHRWHKVVRGPSVDCAVSILDLAPGEAEPDWTASEEKKTARKYQQFPTPLVIDKNRGYRTGRLDLVLQGNFDLMG